MIAIKIATSQAGRTLLEEYPTPNSRKDPSLLKISGVLLNTINVYATTKILIATEVMLRLIKLRFIILLLLSDIKNNYLSFIF